MPLQNRVDPWGNLVATPEHGTLMGNRGGHFHKDDQTLGRRRWASTHWICCELHYKGRHHEPMGQGYTSLFFLDEVTALAAGHRPCFFCRRAEARAFLAGRSAMAFDQELHTERQAPHPVVALADVPQGAVVEDGGYAFARRNGNFLRWSFAGYTEAVNFKSAMQVKLLTAPSIAAILAKGFQPRWHETALQWDD